MGAELRVIARGHAAVRATHAKTLELVREGEIGRAATCVVAVGASLDEDALCALHGRVELTLGAGGVSGSVRGRLNPAFRPGDPLVVRRAAAVTRDALLIDADRGAADLDRALVAELARPGAAVEVTLREVQGAAPGVLVVDPGPLWRVDGGPRPDAPEGGVAAALERGGRVVLRAAPDEGAAAAIVAAAHDAGHTVLPAPGLPPLAAALAVAGVAAERVRFAQGARPGRLEPGTARVVAGVPGDRAERWLKGAERGLIALDPGTPREEYLPWRAGQAVAIPGGARRSAIVVAGPAPAAHGGLDPVATSLAGALLAHGASPRDVARAVQDATGLPRSAAYDAVLALEARRP
jgi:hypothetical protein